MQRHFTQMARGDCGKRKRGRLRNDPEDRGRHWVYRTLIRREEEDLVRQAQRGDQNAVFRTGDVGGALYLVNAGLVRVSFENNEGAEVILGEYGRGQVFGEISLLDSGPRTSAATALVRSKEALFGSCMLTYI